MSQASLKTKFVYSFISGKDDYYLEQLIFSILSLRRYNPTAYVEVLTDDETKRSLTEWRSILYELIDCLNIVDIPRHLDKMKRSRYIKTKLRLLTKGDYLFLDTDTVICGKLSSIEDYTEHIMMVADCNDSLYLKDSQIINRCEIIGFKDMAGRPYYNSGVMRVKDSEFCNSFYRAWHSNWLDSVSKGVSLDQPALNFTNHEFGNDVQELPGRWNCQVFFSGLNCLYESNIIHYAGGGNNERMIEIYRTIRQAGIHSEVLRKYINHPRTLFYMYLTSNDTNMKNRIMILLNVKFHSIYKLIGYFNRH